MIVLPLLLHPWDHAGSSHNETKLRALQLLLWVHFLWGWPQSCCCLFSSFGSSRLCSWYPIVTLPTLLSVLVTPLYPHWSLWLDTQPGYHPNTLCTSFWSLWPDTQLGYQPNTLCTYFWSLWHDTQLGYHPNTLCTYFWSLWLNAHFGYCSKHPPESISDHPFTTLHTLPSNLSYRLTPLW